MTALLFVSVTQLVEWLVIADQVAVRVRPETQKKPTTFGELLVLNEPRMKGSEVIP